MRWILALACAGMAGPVWADAFCDELWLTRNTLFDRAGHCFASPLGRAVFDDACAGNPVTLAPDAARIVDLVREIEDWADCAVDTSRVALDVPHLAARMALIDPPVRAQGESACVGWRGPPLILRAGRADTAPQTGVIMPGENVLFTYVDVDGWTFVPSPTGDARMGWAALGPLVDMPCDGFAG